MSWCMPMFSLVLLKLCFAPNLKFGTRIKLLSLIQTCACAYGHYRVRDPAPRVPSQLKSTVSALGLRSQASRSLQYICGVRSPASRVRHSFCGVRSLAFQVQHLFSACGVQLSGFSTRFAVCRVQLSGVCTHFAACGVWNAGAMPECTSRPP